MSSEELEFNEANVAVASEQESVKKPMRRVTRKRTLQTQKHLETQVKWLTRERKHRNS